MDESDSKQEKQIEEVKGSIYWLYCELDADRLLSAHRVARQGAKA